MGGAAEGLDDPIDRIIDTGSKTEMDSDADLSNGGQRFKAMQQRRQALRRQHMRVFVISFSFLLAVTGILWMWTAYLSARPQTSPAVLLLPLDSRPVNTELPLQLAAIAGIRVVLPEQEALDQFLIPSKEQALYSWLAERDKEVYGLSVIHVNSLLFGGLLHSRESLQYQDANRKLRTMHEYLLFRERASDNTLVLVYILPRLLPSQYDADMWIYETELPELSQLKHRQELALGDSKDAARILELESSIPREIRQRYETVYAEAFNTGRSLLDWLDSGLADEVVIGLDDSAEYGLNVKAFQDLQSTAASRNQQHAYFLHGADELSPLIIARHSLAYDRNDESFVLRYLSEGWEDVILPYEAIPLKDNFQEKTAYLFADKPGEVAESVGGAETSAGIAKYIYLFSDQEATGEQMKAQWDTIRRDRARPSGAYVGLADIAKTNGAWVPFIQSVGPDRVYQYVDAYAGWNTAGNSLGAVMAQLLYWESARALSGPQRREAAVLQANLQKLRLIDDYFFQSVVRQEFIDWAAKEGFNYLAFGSRWMEANDKLQEMMETALTQWPKLTPALPPSQSGEAAWQFRFPWPRSFEVRIDIREP